MCVEMANFFGGGNSSSAFPVRRTRINYVRHETAFPGASCAPVKIAQGVSQWGRELLGPSSSVGEEARAGQEGETGGWREGERGDQVGVRLTYRTCIKGLSPHQADTVS